MRSSNIGQVSSQLGDFSVDDDDFADLGALRSLSPADVIGVTTVSSPTPSPTGTCVAYVKTNTTRNDTGRFVRRATICVRDVATQRTRQLTCGPADSSPTWSGDGGYIAFLRGGQAYVIAVEGGEAKALTDFKVEIHGLKWSPKGNALAFFANVHLDDAGFDATAKRAEKDAKKAFRVYDQLMVRSWDEYVPETRSHLFVVPLELSTAPGDDVPTWRLAAPPRDVMSGVDADCPTHATFGGAEQYAWSPDGSQLVFTCKNRTMDAAWSVNTALHVVRVAAIPGTEKEAMENADDEFLGTHTLANDAVDTNPQWSPDGRTVAWLGTTRPQNEADKMELNLWTLGTRVVTRVSLGDLDVSIRAFGFLANASVAFTADHQGEHKLFVIEDVMAGSTPREVFGDGAVGQMCVLDDKRVLCVHSSFVTAPELATIDIAAGALTHLTENNVASFAALDLPRPRSISIVGAQGQAMQAWLCVPSRSTMLQRTEEQKDRKAKLPLLLLIHGGPQGMWDNSWHARWNLVLWASLGFVCVVPNFTGSTGFGQAHTDAISRNWDVAAQDCLLACNHVLETFDFVDPAQQFAMGASFGGWCAQFLNGFAPGRFTALVAHDGVFDQFSMAFSTDELFFTETEFGSPFDKEGRKIMAQMSPSLNADKWESPILLLHGGRDFRCPLDGSLMAFAAARRRGVRARIAICDTANHWVLEPNASEEWHAIIQEWFQEHCNMLIAWPKN